MRKKAAIAAVAVALVAAAAVAAVHWRDSTHAAAPATSVKAVHDALASRLRSSQLDYQWINCVRNGRSYKGQPIVRCNVDFGDPHIVAYCSVLQGGRLLTDHEQPAIPCGQDRAGDTVSVVHS